MTEPQSKTSNHQRLEEMLFHLTPNGAVIPYSVCTDYDNDIWVSSKGGLFKLDETATKILYKRKNAFPKKIGPYTQVIHFNKKIIYVISEDKANLTEFRILDLSGNVEHEQFMDGKIRSLAVNEKGELFLTKQFAVGSEESVIYKTTVECPLGWEELSSSFDFCFQSICTFDENTLAVSTSSIPINLYSKQSIKWIDSKTGKVLGTFCCNGKEDGQIYFPLCMQRYQDDLLVMDKTGRFQRFMRNGKFSEVCAKIDAYLGNGFTIRNDEVIVACSGIVLDKEGESLCDDWIEVVKIDGTAWVN